MPSAESAVGSSRSRIAILKAGTLMLPSRSR